MALIYSGCVNNVHSTRVATNTGLPVRFSCMVQIYECDHLDRSCFSLLHFQWNFTFVPVKVHRIEFARGGLKLSNLLSAHANEGRS